MVANIWLVYKNISSSIDRNNCFSPGFIPIQIRRQLHINHKEADLATPRASRGRGRKVAKVYADEGPPCYDSDEDTEDASESEMPNYDYYNSNPQSNYTELREQMYLDKLNNLREQLYQLDAGVHPEFIRQLKRVEMQRLDRMLLNDAFQFYETERVEREYVNEKKAALREFEDRKIELRESLILELEDRRRMIENERSSMELLSDCADPKPVTTRKLRRRPNEPVQSTAASDKRRRTSPAQLNHQLEEKDILEDLKVLQRAQSGKKGK